MQRGERAVATQGGVCHLVPYGADLVMRVPISLLEARDVDRCCL